ncbi:putative LRR receptor-like serine/threonine-protein kinase [Hordeum vulgare]|nr:putative LRR receptor-like serine/threonine-protein kinase [Hordeum vulgare]
MSPPPSPAPTWLPPRTSPPTPRVQHTSPPPPTSRLRRHRYAAAHVSTDDVTLSLRFDAGGCSDRRGTDVERCRSTLRRRTGGVDGSNGNDEHVGYLDFDLDISYDEYQQETLDRHWEVMAKTLRSEGEAYMFYNQYAKDRGFSIRRDLKRFGKGMKGIDSMVELQHDDDDVA